jgi:hypothetical protein
MKRIWDKIELNMLSKILLETLLFNVIYLSKNDSNLSRKSSSNGSSLLANKNKIIATNQRNSGDSINIHNISSKHNTQLDNVGFRFSSHKYTLVLDLDETLIHFFYVSYIYIIILTIIDRYRRNVLYKTSFI